MKKSRSSNKVYFVQNSFVKIGNKLFQTTIVIDSPFILTNFTSTFDCNHNLFEL